MMQLHQLLLGSQYRSFISTSSRNWISTREVHRDPFAETHCFVISKQSMTVGIGHRFHARMHIQFRHQTLDVVTHRGAADVQPVRHGHDAGSIGQQAQNFTLPAGQQGCRHLAGGCLGLGRCRRLGPARFFVAAVLSFFFALPPATHYMHHVPLVLARGGDQHGADAELQCCSIGVGYPHG
jgi:hypothetical protein